MPKQSGKNERGKNSRKARSNSSCKLDNSGKSEDMPASEDEMTDVTMLQKSRKKRRGGDNAKTSATRARFLEAYEASFGNISYACEIAKIARMTYYRWMESKSRVNIKFQKRITAIKPTERKLDFLEGKLMELAAQNDTTAVIFGLKTLGKPRGYSEAKNDLELQLVLRAVNRIQAIIDQQVARDATFNPESHMQRLFELAATDFGVSAEQIEKEYFKRQPKGLGK